jgi:Methyltransferase domain
MKGLWMGPDLKRHIPWRVKIAAKVVLARLPVDYSFWERLSLFKHGPMEQPEYAFQIFCRHFERVQFPRKSGGFVCLELGPGDSLFSALIARALGASKVYLVDVAPFARRDVAPYREMMSYLSDCGFAVSEFRECRSVDGFLKACSAEYLIGGLSSLKQIPTKSVDFIWSQAVLEHVRRNHFLSTLRELRRVQSHDGLGSHRIDLRDHLADALNNLRFRERIWESDFMSRSGFYTNRIRYTEMLELFRQAGFGVDVTNVDRWPQVPTAPQKMVAPFRYLPEQELTISGFDVLLTNGVSHPE